MAQCTAKSKRTGQQCRRRAVTGYKVCQVHGAGSPKKGRPGGRPITTGRHSDKLPERLRERYFAALGDSQLTELRDEIALTDARLEDVIGRVDTGESGALWAAVQKAMDAFLEEYPGGANVGEALLGLRAAIQAGQEDWHAWREVAVLVEQRRKLVESESKRLQTMQQMITVESAMTFVAALIDIIRRHVTEPAQLSAIRYELLLVMDRRKKDEPQVIEGTLSGDRGE